MKPSTPVNPTLDALLRSMDSYREELRESNDRYREANDRFARFLRERGVPSVPPPAARKGDWR